MGRYSTAAFVAGRVDDPDPAGACRAEPTGEPIEDRHGAGRAVDQHSGMLVEVDAQPPQRLTGAGGAAQYVEDDLNGQTWLDDRHGGDDPAAPACVDDASSVSLAATLAPSSALRIPADEAALVTTAIARPALATRAAGRADPALRGSGLAR